MVISNQSPLSTYRKPCRLRQKHFYSNAKKIAHRQTALTNDGRIEKKARWKKSFSFSEKWLLTFGIDVTQRDATINWLVTLFDRFSITFRREVSDKKDSTSISVFRNWNGPFRTDLIRRHLTNQQTHKLSGYFAASTIRNMSSSTSVLSFVIHSVHTSVLKMILLSRKYRNQLLKVLIVIFCRTVMLNLNISGNICAQTRLRNTTLSWRAKIFLIFSLVR